jgi:hypothetical protein
MPNGSVSQEPSVAYIEAKARSRYRVSQMVSLALSFHSVSFEQRRQRLLNQDIAAFVIKSVADFPRVGMCDGLSETVSQSCQNVEEI